MLINYVTFYAIKLTKWIVFNFLIFLELYKYIFFQYIFPTLSFTFTYTSKYLCKLFGVSRLYFIRGVYYLRIFFACYK